MWATSSLWKSCIWPLLLWTMPSVLDWSPCKTMSSWTFENSYTPLRASVSFSSQQSCQSDRLSIHYLITSTHVPWGLAKLLLLKTDVTSRYHLHAPTLHVANELSWNSSVTCCFKQIWHITLNYSWFHSKLTCDWFDYARPSWLVGFLCTESLAILCYK